MRTSEEIQTIRDRIKHLKRERATRPNFGKKKTRGKDGLTSDERKEFKTWVKAKNEMDNQE